jgi:hypothetical protein
LVHSDSRAPLLPPDSINGATRPKSGARE